MSIRIIVGDVRERLRDLPDESVQCCVTSPPYWGLRDYGQDDQIGLEQTPNEYVAQMVDVFREVRRVLRDDGTLWLNLGDSYAGNACGLSDGSGSSDGSVGRGPAPKVDRKGNGLKPKDLVGIPWRVAFALQADGWWLRQDIIWHKPNPMPESVTDRCTKAHEYVFLLSKSARYFFDSEAIAEPALRAGDRAGGSKYSSADAHIATRGRHTAATLAGLVSETRNRRSVWSIATKPFSGAHFAVMTPDLAELCIKAGTKESDTVLDPFGGAGTTSLVADRLKRDAIMIELNPEYAKIAEQRLRGDAPMFVDIEVA